MGQQGVIVLQMLAGAGLELAFQFLILALLHGGQILAVEHLFEVQLIGQGGQLLLQLLDAPVRLLLNRGDPVTGG